MGGPHKNTEPPIQAQKYSNFLQMKNHWNMLPSSALHYGVRGLSMHGASYFARQTRLHGWGKERQRKGKWPNLDSLNTYDWSHWRRWMFRNSWCPNIDLLGIATISQRNGFIPNLEAGLHVRTASRSRGKREFNNPPHIVSDIRDGGLWKQRETRRWIPTHLLSI